MKEYYKLDFSSTVLEKLSEEKISSVIKNKEYLSKLISVVKDQGYSELIGVFVKNFPMYNNMTYNILLIFAKDDESKIDEIIKCDMEISDKINQLRKVARGWYIEPLVLLYC